MTMLPALAILFLAYVFVWFIGASSIWFIKFLFIATGSTSILLVNLLFALIVVASSLAFALLCFLLVQSEQKRRETMPKQGVL